MYIIGGTASKNISQDLSKELNEPVAQVLIKRFPDKEGYVRILDDLKGEDVIIVQTTYPDPNIVELFLIQNAASEAKAKSITVIIPYFGYGRQDKKFEEGEAVSAKTIAEHISINTDRTIVIDPHKEHVLDFFTPKAQGCTAIPALAKYLKKFPIDLVLAPDKGALERAKQAATILNAKYDFIEKKRVDEKTINIRTKNLDITDKNAVILDDIISTGGTMAKTVYELKKQGAKKIIAACTHGLFIGDAIDKISSAGCDEIISTDTIQNEFSKVKTAPCLSELFLKK